MIDKFCLKCGRLLTSDEKALYRKTVRRCADEFMCLTCMAEYFNVSEDVLNERIKTFREMGCSMF